MTLPNADSLARKIVLSDKRNQKDRIKALKLLRKPSLNLLQTIVRNPRAQGRLAALTAQLYAEQVALKQLKQEEAEHAAKTQANPRTDSSRSRSQAEEV